MTGRRSKYKSQKSNSTTSRARYRAAAKKRQKNLQGKKIRKVVLSLLSVCVSLLIVFGYFFINRLNKQFVGAQSANSIQNGYYSMAYVVLDDTNAATPLIINIDIKIFDSANNKVTTYTIPRSYKINLGNKYGEVEAEKLFALGLLQDETAGSDSYQTAVKFVNGILFETLAFPIDRYVYTDTATNSFWDQLLAQGNFIPFLAELLLHTGNPDNTFFAKQTNMSLAETYQVAKFVLGLPEDRNTVAAYSDVATNDIDNALRELTLDSGMALEAESMAVLNASGTPGLAGFGSRVIKNLGGRVVSVDNSQLQFGESFIVTDTPEGITSTMLAKVFGISKVLSKSQAIEYVYSSELYRADVLVVLVN